MCSRPLHPRGFGVIHPGRLAVLALLGVTAIACGGGDSTAPSADPPLVAGTYDVTGNSTNDILSQFTFSGLLVLSQPGDPPGGTLGGTITLTFSRPEWSTSTVGLVDASVDSQGNIRFLATTAAGPGLWQGQLLGTAIANGRYGSFES
jgi:hypothetical protein